jgi:antibiotic biosynthesis monooxygenase (ABM) superfamily enzyme
MIVRLWRGYTTPDNAQAYEDLLRSEVMPGIAARKVAGYRGMCLARRTFGEEVEFVTLMRFDSMDAVKAFAGEDYETAVVPPKARQILKRFDARSAHFEVVEDFPPSS